MIATGPMYLPNPFYEFFNSIIRMPQYCPFPGRRAYFKHFFRWQYDAFFGPRQPAEGPQRLTVILLSYKRVRNMQPLVRSLLKADFVDRIIVSNNNPDYRIRDWIRLRDERIHLIDQPVRRAPGIRFALAKDEPGEYFLSIDDDSFLHPAQIQGLFRELVARPGSPHGIQGELYLGTEGPREPGERMTHLDRHGFKVNVCYREQQVDILNRVYAFTREHVNEMYRLGSRLGLEMGAIANGEDILLSASGQDRPYIHDLGVVGECLSGIQKGVSTWRSRQDFFKERADLFLTLRGLKDSSSGSLSHHG
jgi:glycosyltransferase involved in cell wall biosynthesis